MSDEKGIVSWNIRAIRDALESEGLLVKVKGDSGVTFSEIVTDSRKIRQNCVFVALKGDRFDGHEFAANAAKNGAELLIVERMVGAKCAEIQVTDTAEAYGVLARTWRSQFRIPVVCVVGANGKTTTTQMLASILRTACGTEGTVATMRNHNNSIGVPSTLLRFNRNTKAAVVEAGMNHPGEMARLINWIRPTVVVVTNAQREHQEFIDGVEGSARENGMAIVGLSAKGTAVLPAKDACLHIWKDYARARGCLHMTYCEGESDDSHIVAERNGGSVTISVADDPAKNIETTVALAGSHAVHDAAAAAAAAYAIGVMPEAIRQGLARFQPVEGRGKRTVLSNGVILIDDSYNANPDSMRAAIDVLSTMSGSKVLIIGDMAEVGQQNCRRFHEEIGAYAKQRGIDKIFAVGPAMRDAVAKFGAGAKHCATIEELEKVAESTAHSPGTILVKGSNSMGLARVVRHLVNRIGQQPE